MTLADENCVKVVRGESNLAAATAVRILEKETMPSPTVAEAVDISHEIFELLKRTGPLCASQIAVELGLPLKKIGPVLEQFKQEGMVELRPDRDRTLPYDGDETPWALARPNWLRSRAR